MPISHSEKSQEQLGAAFTRICETFPFDGCDIKQFVQLSGLLLQICDRATVALALKVLLRRISEQYNYRPSQLLAAHDNAQLYITHISSTTSAPDIVSSHTAHTALKLIAGGPVHVSILCPRYSPLAGDSSLNCERLHYDLFDHQFLTISAGSAVALEAPRDAVLVEVLSPRLLTYSINIDRLTCRISSIDCLDTDSMKRTLLHVALELMLAGQPG